MPATPTALAPMPEMTNRRHAKCVHDVSAAHLVGGRQLFPWCGVMRFFIGVAFGALAMWAYRSGKVQSLASSAPEPVQQAYNRTAERINQVATNDQVRQIASTVQDKVQRANAPQIVMPSAAEVAGRPSEPLPRYEPEGVQTQNP
jgi:hypothetical protein